MSILFYNIFLWFYRLGIGIASWWNPKARLWLGGRKGIFDKIRREMSERGAGEKGPVVWMHCASLGEFEQGRPVLEGVRRQYPGARIVLSFFSPSGYEVRKGYAGADHVFYLPLDSRVHARQFIDQVNPSLVLWIKYDYWYYYLTECRKRGIPVLLLSGIFRPDQPFFKWYGRLHRYMLECFTHLFVQEGPSRELLGRLGFSKNISMAGDTRFDRVAEIAGSAVQYPIIDAFCGEHPVIVAGSTWPEDEEEIDHYANTHPEIRFIIAPHEIDRDHLREIERLFKHTVFYSALSDAALSAQFQQVQGGMAGRLPGEKAMTDGGEKTGRVQGDAGTAGGPAGKRGGSGGAGGLAMGANVNTLIIDNIGMLAHLYRYATISYVGGGFGDDGVHNVLEAAVFGRPVVYGPVIEKFIEAVELADCGGGIVIDSALEAEAVFSRLLLNKEEYRQAGEASRNYVFQKTGATARILGFIQENRLLTN